MYWTQQKKIKDPKFKTRYFGKCRDEITLNVIYRGVRFWYQIKC